MSPRSAAKGTKGRIGVLAVALMLFTAAPVFGQDGDRNGVNVVDQDGAVVNGSGVDQSNESNNNRETSQSQSAEVNDSAQDNRSVSVDQGDGQATAIADSDSLVGPAVAVGTGPVLSPPVTVANNDILTNKNKTTHLNQSQSYEDNSEFSDDHSRTLINDSFNESPGSSVSIGRRTNSDVIILGDRDFDSKKTVSFDLVPTQKTLPRTGPPDYTFWLLAAALLSIVFGMFLEYSGWRGKNGLLPLFATGGFGGWEPRLPLERLSAARLSLASSLSFAGTVPQGLGEGLRGWTESVLLTRHLAPAGLAPDDSGADRADRDLFVLKLAVLAVSLLLAFVCLKTQ